MDDNEILKRFSGGIDLKKPSAIRPFEVVEGDTGNVLELTVTDAGEPVDLTGADVKAVFSSALGLAVEESPDGVSAEGSSVVLELFPGSFAPGVVECELQIYSAGERGRLVTTARFNFTCRRALLNGDSIKPAPGFPLLCALAEEIALAEEERCAAESARDAAESERAQAETLRAAAENARAAAESARAAAEAVRSSAESGRASAEETRSIAESLRQNAEQQRAGAEAGRAAAESARETAETARVQSESARVNNELSRTRAERDRAAAESARAAAEAARETAFAEMTQSLGPGIRTGQGAPPAALTDPGTVYLDTVSETPYMQTGAAWRRIALDEGWETVQEYTLSEACAALEFSGTGFSYRELKLTVFRSLAGSSIAGVYINGLNTPYIRDSTFALTEIPDTLQAVTVLYVRADDPEGFISTERHMGGVTDNAGLSATKAVHTGVLPLTGGCITALKVACLSGGSFRAGTRIKLEGRKTV